VENSFSINDVVHELKTQYPALEMVYVNQNMKLRSLNVKPDERIPALILPEENILGRDLKEFKTNFSF